MAVRVNNISNIRKAKRWDEKDDAALCLLLKRKLKDVDVALRESESPYERARLKAQKKHYKVMLQKVESGVYNGDIIFAELQAASILRSEQALRRAELSTVSGGRRYHNSYENMDFDYESAFRKKRYYGVALPVILLALSLVFVLIFVMGAFLPAKISDAASAKGISLDTLMSYKLGQIDIEIINDGNWPGGTYTAGKKPVKGEPYVDSDGNEPERVKLNRDLGMTSIDITPFDVVKAWFRTPMLRNTRLDFIEDMKAFQGESYYYLCFLSGSKEAALVIQKDADGNYDRSVIMRHIGTYGTIMFLIAAFLLGLVNIVICIIRLFTYTSRRIHVMSLVCFILSALCMISPAFATVEGTAIGASFKAYFSSLTNFRSFLQNESAVAGIGILFLFPVIISLVSMILPFLFRNRLKKRPTFVPRGNKNRNPYNDPLYVDEETLRNLI